jgi:hypothetical protein
VRTIGTKRAETLEERVGAANVLHREQAGLFALENLRAELVPDEVAHLAAEERRESDRQAHPPDVDLDTRAADRHRAGEGEEARDHEQGVTGEQEPDEQAGLCEHDEAHSEQRERAEALD